jgi:hypothetical protein
MQNYCLFIFDRFARKVEETREFRAVDDRTAIELTRGWRRARDALARGASHREIAAVLLDSDASRDR